MDTALRLERIRSVAFPEFDLFHAIVLPGRHIPMPWSEVTEGRKGGSLHGQDLFPFQKIV
jgi:hypothetical protein